MKCYDYKRITSETEFMLDKIDFTDDAYADHEQNVITIGCDCLTLETLIHELNEIETIEILKNLGYENKRISIKLPIIKHEVKLKGKKVIIHKKQEMSLVCTNWVSHFISPHGLYSFIYPYNKENEEEQLDE